MRLAVSLRVACPCQAGLVPVPIALRNMKNVFQYTNYREFLRDYYEERKERDGYTYRDFAEDAGMNSSSWLLHLVKGVKNLSDESAKKIASALHLKKRETDYFLLMVSFTQARNSAEKDKYYTLMIALKKKLRLMLIGEAQYEYYTKWYYPVIRSLVSKIDFGDDYPSLAKHLIPAITPQEARKAISLLRRLGLIARNESGRWVQTDEIISTGNEVSSLCVVNYHKQVSRLASEAFDNIPREQRDISSLTLGINEEDFERIRDRIIEFRRELIEIARSSEHPDRVYQLNFQLFPVGRGEDVKW